MVSEIAKSRIGEVIRIDTVTSTQADFLATHVPVSNIHIKKKWDSKDETKREFLKKIFCLNNMKYS